MNKVSKSFAGTQGHKSLQVLKNITLDMHEGDFVGILGPSGCGKSTLLNIIAGFESSDEGEVIYCNNPVYAPSPERSMVFQSSVLFPWLTVRDNIAYGLKRKGENKKNIYSICQSHIQIVGLQGFERYYPHQLSGGMQQRVALARALAVCPKILLMDEPFSSLDIQTKLAMQQLLLELWERIRFTIIFVTHDVEEALLLTDKIYIMKKSPGEIVRKIHVPFLRPRSFALTGTVDFCKLKNEVLNML